ncbi:MFS transporter [Billgrantia pellis]|uniref:MFS transporter n=1 Tax=Billgrantia pellis TaxID=2606936 RepID=UPI001E3B2D23|nr:MFS transporter [Halomonas pellis]
MNRSNNRWLLLAAVLLAFTPVMIDLTILHIAIPSLTLDLRATGTEVLWILDIYPLIMAGLLVPMGVLTDRLGTRRMLLTGMSIFTAASIWAAFSTSAPMLIAARAALALGSAMMMPPVLAAIRRGFEDERERGIALGLWGTVAAAGAAVGPLIGGILLDYFWWGSVFLINVPIMLLVAPLVYKLVPDDAAPSRAPWPIGQALLLIAGLMTSVYALKSIVKPDQPVVTGLIFMAIGLSLLTVFGRLQLRLKTPMLDLSLFKRPPVRAGLIMALVASGALAGAELTLAQELQFVIRLSPLEAGLFLLPLMAAAAVGGPIGGWLASVIGLKWLACISLGAAAASLGGLAVSDFHAPGADTMVLLAILGLALSVGLTASSIAVMSAISPEKAGSAGSLEATAYDLGSGLGITGFGVMLSAVYARAISMPDGLAPTLASQARTSIGETMIVASSLADAEAASLINAAQDAFSLSHMAVLGAAATLLGSLAVLVFRILRNQPKHITNAGH